MTSPPTFDTSSRTRSSGLSQLVGNTPLLEIPFEFCGKQRAICKHRIQGISDEFIPPIVDLAALDGIIAVSDGDSILMAQKLASTLGLGVGISSGCNFLAAVKL